MNSKKKRIESAADNLMFLTTSQLADKLCVSKRHIYDLVQRRVIPRLKVGKLVRFELGAVLKALHTYEEKEFSRNL